MKRIKFGAEIVCEVNTNFREKFLKEALYSAITALQIYITEKPHCLVHWRWLQPDEVSDVYDKPKRIRQVKKS